MIYFLIYYLLVMISVAIWITAYNNCGTYKPKYDKLPEFLIMNLTLLPIWAAIIVIATLLFKKSKFFQ